MTKGKPAGVRRRLSTMAIDQAIAGGSNVLAAVLAARTLDTASFGLFGIVFLVYTMAQVGVRAVICEPLLVHPEEARTRSAEIVGTACVVGMFVALVILLSGFAAFAWDDRLGQSLLVLAACMPFMVIQDLGRYLSFARRRPGSAVTLDSIWLVLMVSAVGFLAAIDSHRLLWFITAWAASGALAGLVLFWQNRLFHIRIGLSWLRTAWVFSWRYFLASMAAQGAALGASFILGVISGARAVGSVVGATLLVRPFMTFQIASIAAGISEVAGDEQSRGNVLRHVRRTCGVTSAAAVVNMAVLLTLPDVLGRAILGETWEATQPLLLPTTLQTVLLGIISGPRVGLYGLRAVRKSTALDIAGASMLLCMTVVGATVNGALGAVWAVSFGLTLVAAAWWLVFVVEVGRVSVERPSHDLPSQP